MPIDFACDGCELRFSIGWYHHHSRKSGYGSSTLAVCRECGAQHRIERASDLSSLPSSISFFDAEICEVPPAARLRVISRLRREAEVTLRVARAWVASPPILLGRDLREHRARMLGAAYAELGAIISLTETRRERLERPAQQRDRLLMRIAPPNGVGTSWHSLDIRGAISGPNGIFELNRQACGHCAGIATLVTDTNRAPQSCPRCRSSLRRATEWIT